MGHVTRKTDWCVIDLDTEHGVVLLSERWLYDWRVNGKEPAWTLAEKRDFHRRSDRAIWAGWSGRALLTVSGTSPFAKRFAGRRLTVNLDIRWVLARPHWTVQVTKMPGGAFYPSNVDWHTHRIFLGSRDHRAVTRDLGHGSRQQVTVAHEFGHAFGNSYVFGRGDEYPKPAPATPSPHVADDASIMHIGHKLRVRHFTKLVEELNLMVPGTRFAVTGVS